MELRTYPILSKLLLMYTHVFKYFQRETISKHPLTQFNEIGRFWHQKCANSQCFRQEVLHLFIRSRALQIFPDETNLTGSRAGFRHGNLEFFRHSRQGSLNKRRCAVGHRWQSAAQDAVRPASLIKTGMTNNRFKMENGMDAPVLDVYAGIAASATNDFARHAQAVEAPPCRKAAWFRRSGDPEQWPWHAPAVLKTARIASHPAGNESVEAGR